MDFMAFCGTISTMNKKLTPLMKQYFDIREKYPDSILLFQVGDFYELFFEDAKKASEFLAITLTKRGKHKGDDIPLCGVPVHAINHYIVKLVKGGFKVALCEQVTKPQPGKVVERAVTKVFTPGTLTDEQMLDNRSASYLLSVFPDKEKWGLIFAEILTAQMLATSIEPESYRMLESELIRFSPDEIILNSDNLHIKKYFLQNGYVVSETSLESEENVAEWTEKTFGDVTLKQLQENKSIQGSLYSLYWYLKKNQESALTQFRSIQFYQPEDYLILDASTQKNLEIIRNAQNGGRKNTLFSVLDAAVTPMGSRMIKKWLQRPLVQKQAILQRQEVVSALSKNVEAMQCFKELFEKLSDVERIVGRIALQRALLQDFVALKNSLKIVPQMKLILQQYLLFYVTEIVQEKLIDFSILIDLLDCALNDDTTKKHIIKSGFDCELDRLRTLVENSQQAVLQLEQREIERTGITSLKIRYNNIAGYYIEITKANVKNVPDDYIQQQTLVNRNRYVTQELKDLERDIIRAQNEIDFVEKEVFQRVKNDVFQELSSLRRCSQALAYLDGLFGLARVAYNNGYIVPVFTEKPDIVIEQGRHPIVEGVIEFIPNDTHLTEQESMWLVTGPNMGGKSTYLRQVALLCIMAQMGSLIPANSAELPTLDRIFTRIGSGDNLAQGKSTFLVEMEETAVICSQATENSLVILDEVGRGTSTFDGMAIAQAIVEHIAVKIRARCLFATHYHELTQLSEHFSNIENYHMACKRAERGVLFLYHILRGVAPGSFGLEVARLAQLPASVVDRAEEVLGKLSSQPGVNNASQDSAIALGHEVSRLKEELAIKNEQLALLEGANLDNLSPRQAFELVWKMREKR
jgi:DNA mismatch repair protein MutS